jgi:hypothetical protein
MGARKRKGIGLSYRPARLHRLQVKKKYRTDKKENQIFLIYNEIFHSGAVAKSYMRKGFLIYEEMR